MKCPFHFSLHRRNGTRRAESISGSADEPERVAEGKDRFQMGSRAWPSRGVIHSEYSLISFHSHHR